MSEKTGNLYTYFTSSFLSCCIQTQIVSMTFNVSPLCLVEEGSKNSLFKFGFTHLSMKFL